MLARIPQLGLFGLSLVSLVGLTAAAPPAERRPSECFSLRDWSGWKATPDARAMYIRVRINDVYRLDFVQSCPATQWIGAHLVTRTHGGGLICTPLDLDLRVSSSPGFATPCIIDKITPLTPAEAVALPKPLKP